MQNPFSWILSEANRKRLNQEFETQMKKRRRSVEQGLPRPRLRSRHVENCRILVDRDELLMKLPRNGVVAELGVDRGEFSRRILELTDPEKLHLVDPWNSDRYSDDRFEEVKRCLTRELSAGKVEIHKQMSTEVFNDFVDGYFDWIYIDTDHSYKTTICELLSFAPKVKPEGIITGHDYVKGNWISGVRYGVMEAVHEFCVDHNWELLYQTADLVEWSSFAIRRITTG